MDNKANPPASDLREAATDVDDEVVMISRAELEELRELASGNASIAPPSRPVQERLKDEAAAA